MTRETLRRALACARRGWPVLPCWPGTKTPLTKHGYQDASTDPGQIIRWFGRGQDWNLAIATGAPGPDVLDVDDHGLTGNGFAALTRLRDAGLTEGASTWVITANNGLHLYFAGSAQRSGRLKDHHLDFKAAGGYVIAPPSRVDGGRYQVIQAPGGRAGLDWHAVSAFLQPQPALQQPALPQPHPSQRGAPGNDIAHLARWVASQPEGNRNAGLFWAANRALDTDPAADLSPLAAAARQAGLPDPEITRTLHSAQHTTRNHQHPDPQAESH